MIDDHSIWFGYQLVPSSISYFDLDIMMQGDSMSEATCPACYRDGQWIALIEDEAESWGGETIEDLLGVYLAVRVVIIKCVHCGHEMMPIAVMLKNETTGEVEEVLKDA